MKYVLPLLLAGCASTPQEVMTDGPRTTHALKQALAIAAGCLARNIENHNFVYSAAVRQVDDRTTEVVVRVPAVGRTVSVAQPSRDVDQPAGRGASLSDSASSQA
jgi:hypothetical protein